MDIRKWLNEIAPGHDDKPRVLSANAGKDSRADQHFDESSTERHSKEHLHRRNSVSSLPESVSRSSSSSSTDGSHSSSDGSSELYRRRKRHKTRHDLYDVNSGARKRRSNATTGKKKMKKRSKDRQAKKGHARHQRTEKPKKGIQKPGQKLLSNFAAPNIVGSRLTVRSLYYLETTRVRSANARAARVVTFAYQTRCPSSLSSLITPTQKWLFVPANSDLPDLTFSEMRFLSRPVVEDGPLQAVQVTKESKRRKEYRKQEQDQVTAYFSNGKTSVKDVTNQRAGQDKQREHVDMTLFPESTIEDVHEGAEAEDAVKLPVFQGCIHDRNTDRPCSSATLPWSASHHSEPAPSSASLRPASTVAAGELCGRMITDFGNVIGAGIITKRGTPYDQASAERTRENSCTLAHDGLVDHAVNVAAGDHAVPTAAYIRSNNIKTTPGADTQRTTREVTKDSSSSPFAKLLRACDQAIASPEVNVAATHFEHERLQMMTEPDHFQSVVPDSYPTAQPYRCSRGLCDRIETPLRDASDGFGRSYSTALDCQRSCIPIPNHRRCDIVNAPLGGTSYPIPPDGHSHLADEHSYFGSWHPQHTPLPQYNDLHDKQYPRDAEPTYHSDYFEYHGNRPVPTRNETKPMWPEQAYHAPNETQIADCHQQLTLELWDVGDQSRQDYLQSGYSEDHERTQGLRYLGSEKYAERRLGGCIGGRTTGEAWTQESRISNGRSSIVPTWFWRPNVLY